LISSFIEVYPLRLGRRFGSQVDAADRKGQVRRLRGHREQAAELALGDPRRAARGGDAGRLIEVGGERRSGGGGAVALRRNTAKR
jgi:hypothetical protein